MLPSHFYAQLELFLHEESLALEGRSLQEACQAISRHYQGQGISGKKWTSHHYLAYVLSRLPATSAACEKVFQTLRQQGVSFPTTLLDVGAGPGAVAWALHACEAHDVQLHALECDPFFLKFSQKVRPEKIKAEYDANLFLSAGSASADWVVLSYVLCEQSGEEERAFIEKAWDLAHHALIIVQPGTPAGYQQLLHARQWLLEAGGEVIAPCPHGKPCPLQGDDWCHFQVRVQRQQLHKYIKQGDAPFEDEKFSYLVMGKPGMCYKVAQARILRHPLYRKGHLLMTLCEPEGVRRATVSARAGAFYREARHKEWGDDLGKLPT